MAERTAGRPALGSGRIGRGLEELARAERRAQRARTEITARALHEERLRRVESDLADLRGRVHGLIFLAIGTVVAQVIVQVLG